MDIKTFLGKKLPEISVRDWNYTPIHGWDAWIERVNKQRLFVYNCTRRVRYNNGAASTLTKSSNEKLRAECNESVEKIENLLERARQALRLDKKQKAETAAPVENSSAGGVEAATEPAAEKRDLVAEAAALLENAIREHEQNPPKTRSPYGFNRKPKQKPQRGWKARAWK